MANRMPLVGGSFGTGGSWYGSELQVAVAIAPTGITYLSTTSASILAPFMPGVFMLSSTNNPAGGSFNMIQYSPDSGTTWRGLASIGSGATLIAIDGSPNFRLLGGTAAANIFFVPVKII